MKKMKIANQNKAALISLVEMLRPVFRLSIGLYTQSKFRACLHRMGFIDSANLGCAFIEWISFTLLTQGVPSPNVSH